jgi:Bacterial SH3 domain
MRRNARSDWRAWRLLAAAAVVFSSHAQAGSAVPVHVGGLEIDACPTLGVVTGLNPQGDNFLAVRSGPGTDFVKIDELYQGERVLLCDERGQWVGIVYTRDDADCGVAGPQAERTAYTGPCRSGWVFGSYITVIAG